jgi:MGT family glycosyltransferase
MSVLMVTWDAGGNLPPLLALGRELQRRGHRVHCLAPETVRGAAVRSGVVFRPLRHGALFDPLAAVPVEQSQQAQAHVFFDDGYIEDVRAEVEYEQPDVIVIDCFLVNAQAASEAIGVPFALLVHTLPGWFMAFWDRVFLGATNAVRARMNLVSVASTADLWARADRTLVATTPLLDGDGEHVADLPRLRYVGPLLEREDADEQAGVAVRSSGDPLVLVSFSTTFMEQEEALSRTIGALRMLPVRAIVTTGPAVRPAALPAARNVTVRRWVPHAAVLRETALVITHAGHSTVVKALAYGVPLLCIPLGRDQRFIAERVESLGAGVSVPADAAPDRLASAITLLLREASYREAAQRVASAIRAEGFGAERAAAELEALSAGPA